MSKCQLHLFEALLIAYPLALEPKKTRLVEFGRFAQRDAKKWGEKLETIYFLGFTHFCTRNKAGNFMVGRKTEKSRLRRGMEKLRELMRDIRHHKVIDQAKEINQVLRDTMPIMALAETITCYGKYIDLLRNIGIRCCVVEVRRVTLHGINLI